MKAVPKFKCPSLYICHVVCTTNTNKNGSLEIKAIVITTIEVRDKSLRKTFLGSIENKYCAYISKDFFI